MCRSDPTLTLRLRRSGTYACLGDTAPLRAPFGSGRGMGGGGEMLYKYVWFSPWRLGVSITNIHRTHTHLSHAIKPQPPITHPIHRQSTPPPSTPQSQNGSPEQSCHNRRRCLRSKAHQVCLPSRLPAFPTQPVSQLTNPPQREEGTKESQRAVRAATTGAAVPAAGPAAVPAGSGPIPAGSPAVCSSWGEGGAAVVWTGEDGRALSRVK